MLFVILLFFFQIFFSSILVYIYLQLVISVPQLEHISVCCQLVVLVLVNNNNNIFTIPYFYELSLCKASFCFVTHMKCKEIFLVYICKAQLSFRCSSVVSLWSKWDFCWEMLPLNAALISLLFRRRHRLILIYVINTFCALTEVYICACVRLYASPTAFLHELRALSGLMNYNAVSWGSVSLPWCVCQQYYNDS